MFQIRENRKPQGRKKLIAERRAYFEFMRKGMSSKAAARAVGIEYNREQMASRDADLEDWNDRRRTIDPVLFLSLPRRIRSSTDCRSHQRGEIASPYRPALELCSFNRES